MYRVIDPSKIRQIRGNRTRKDVLGRIDFQISQQELYAYELGKYRPSEKKLPYLLKALNCTYEDITRPVEVSVVRNVPRR